MANTFLTTDLVAREALMLLRNNLVAARLFDRQYESEFTGQEKVGDTIRLRRRDEGSVQEFTTTITKDTIDETNIDLVLEKHYDASFEVTTRELTLSIQDFSSQVIAPRIIQIAEQVDSYALLKLKDIPSFGGPSAATPAALPASIGDVATIRQTLNEQKVPLQQRIQIVSPEYEAALLSIDSFVEANKRGDNGRAIDSANLGFVMGMSHFMGQGVDSATFTSGTQTDGVIDGSASPIPPGTTTIPYDGGGAASGTLLIGDSVNIAGYGDVMIAGNDTAVTNAGNLILKEPTRKAIADDAVFTKYDAASGTRQLHGCAFHPRAFAFASIPLAIPPGANGSRIEEGGLSIRVVQEYDIDSKKSIMSMDVLVGALLVEPRLATQVVKNI